MKTRLYLNSLLYVSATFLLIGCNKSDDEAAPSEPINILVDEMAIDSENDIDWEKASLTWNNEFSDSVLSENQWNFASNSNNIEVADQWQVYQKQNAVVNNGNLIIEAKKVGEGQKKGDYSSSKLTNTTAFQYGRIEIRAKLPSGEKNGIWAKLSLVGANESLVGWPECGELNLMEYLSYRPNQTYVTVHSNANNSDNGTLIIAFNDLESVEEEFHAYGLLWTKEYLKFYIDEVDNIIYAINRPDNPTADTWPFDQPFFFKSDLVVGGKFGGAEGVDDDLFPATMEIDYIRVYHSEP